ncbi:ABC transporter ATP-binding protein [Micrococcus flavus]|uniref:ATP-binding cassette subfamily B protein n=1 Tax=Micrococcus flavus TaxID=384602 RepID=A0A4Y8WWS9_9MICC|nr:ABC transporter ATP-binding protein [Micrococcus flavus]MBB4881699.1 ATP-binding cassette subfamily B protein [Micrococcus flavus]TFH98764.1 ABC transporter ATP-binding protein [Micrococcus flavus]GGK54141.1 multidrug ABC transporter ATP-binding protein [Micrococcus flavus]
MLWTLLRRYGRPYRTAVLAVVVLQLISTLAMLYLPSLNARIIDEGVARGDTARIWDIGLVMLGVALVQVVAAIAAVWFGAKAAMGVGRDLRRAVYTRVDAFSAEELGRFGAATLITRGTNDVNQVQMLTLMALNFMVAVPIMAVGGIIMAIREDPGLSWLVWVSVPVLLVIVAWIVARLMPLFQRMQDNIDDVNGVLREQIQGIRVVRAFVRERHETRRFTDANAALTETSVRIGRLFVLLGPVITMILHLATAAVLWFGGERVDAGLVQVGALTAFMQYLLQILMAVMMGTFMMMMLPRAVVSAGRIGEVLDTVPTLAEPAHPVEPAQRRGEVEFRDVTFAYPGAEAPVLDGVSFTVAPGTTTAIIGSTGAGKSTLVNLIPRLYDATDGQVLLDGVPVTQLARAELTRAVALVPQKPFLFSGTVAENMRFGAPHATEEQIWAALETAQAADFVRDRTTGEGEAAAHGLESRLSQGGTDVSGGQRQRLSIARALVAAPRILVFDDSFSALDVTTDARLRGALDARAAGITRIVVAQRVATITEADQIVVLDEGRVVGRGTHAELLAGNETYRQIVDSQVREEEPA